jgi:serine/threonine-protein phosphatase 2A regulatory subunit B
MSLAFSFGGTEVPCEADTITAVEFDDSGAYLATADCGGRCVIFKTQDSDMNNKPARINPPKHGPPVRSITNYGEVNNTDVLEEKDMLLALSKDDSDSRDSIKDYDGKNSPSADDANKSEQHYKVSCSNDKSTQDSNEIKERKVWVPYHQFQSHDAEFDYLKSLEIEAKVNQIRFIPSSNKKILVLTTNDKTIKLWKLSQKYDYSNSDNISTCGFIRSNSGTYCDDVDNTTTVVPALSSHNNMSSNKLKLPQKCTNGIDAGIFHGSAGSSSTTLYTNVKKSYQNAHTYHINSLSLNSDNESFISSDDLRINMWNIEDSTKCFNIIDCKPKNMEDLNEIITCSTFHPSATNIMAFSTSKGAINLVDLRSSAICSEKDFINIRRTRDIDSSTYDDQSYGSIENSHLFGELMCNVLDLKFNPDNGRYLVSRDYLSMKVWDTHMPHKPVSTVPLHSHLKPLLPQLYESESIFDKFTLNFSPCGKRIITGGYNNMFTIRDVSTGKQVIEGELPHYLEPGRCIGGIRYVDYNNTENKLNHMDIRTDQRVVHCAWHPLGGTLAIAGVAGLHIFNI